MMTFSRRASSATARGRSLIASAGMTTAPCRSAWMTLFGDTIIPATLTVPPKSTRWTWACEGMIEPARTKKSGAIASRSRTEPSVTTPAQPSPLWTLLCTSPPKRAKACIRDIDVLDNGDTRQRRRGDMLVVGEPHSGRLLPAARVRLARTNQSRPSKGNDGLQLRESGDQGPAREAVRTAGRNNELERVANRWSIELPQSMEISGVRQLRHGGFL